MNEIYSITELDIKISKIKQKIHLLLSQAEGQSVSARTVGMALNDISEALDCIRDNLLALNIKDEMVSKRVSELLKWMEEDEEK